MLYGSKGPILIERIHHLLATKYGSKEERKCLANQALQYFEEIDYYSCPYAELFWSVSEKSKPIFKLKRPRNLTDEELALEKTLAHEYKEAIALLENLKVEPSNTVQRLEKITQVYFLSKNYKALEELEFRLTNLRNASDIISYTELESYRSCILLICASYYMHGRYMDCCNKFFNILEEDPEMLNTLSAKESAPFLNNEEFIYMITISIIVSIPLDNYDSFIYLDEIQGFCKAFPILVKCLKLLISTSFKKFFTLWNNDINAKCIRSPFIYQSWGSVQCMMRSKIFFFYLRFSNKITISYLSETLGIDYNLIRSEILQIIISGKLNFVIEDDIIYYKSKHILEDALKGLEKNYDMINEILELKKLKNETLRNTAQDIIINNNNLARENALNHVSTLKTDDSDDSDREVLSMQTPSQEI